MSKHYPGIMGEAIGFLKKYARLVASARRRCIGGVLGSSNHEQGTDAQPRLAFRLGRRSGVSIATIDTYSSCQSCY